MCFICVHVYVGNLVRFATDIILNFVTAFKGNQIRPVESRSAMDSVIDCRSRGRELDPGPISYFHGAFSMVILLLPLIQEELLSATNKSMCTEKWLTA